MHPSIINWWWAGSSSSIHRYSSGMLWPCRLRSHLWVRWGGTQGVPGQEGNSGLRIHSFLVVTHGLNDVTRLLPLHCSVPAMSCSSTTEGWGFKVRVYLCVGTFTYTLLWPKYLQCSCAHHCPHHVLNWVPPGFPHPIPMRDELSSKYISYLSNSTPAWYPSTCSSFSTWTVLFVEEFLCSWFVLVSFVKGQINVTNTKCCTGKR